MPTLFVNHFRGFESTFLSLKKINFFVGENSTGKTSLLKLIGIISTPGFWRYNEFGDKDKRLGNYSDITKNPFFEIGILADSDEQIGDITAIKFRFIELGDKPSIKEIWILTNDLSLQISVEGKNLKYRFKIDSKNFVDDFQRLSYFKKWIFDNQLKNVAFLKEEIDFVSIQSILLQIQMVLNRKTVAVKKNRKEGVLNFTIQNFLTGVAWIAPIRSEPLSIYDEQPSNFQSGGSHAPFILKEIINGVNVKKILNKFGSDSGLFKDINIELERRKNPQSPFRIIVNLENKKLNLTNVGYGLSQILPIVIEVIARPDNFWFAIQQPEVHLHPRAQAAFGDFVFKSLQVEGQRFIIETHSDYLIDRFRLRVNRALREKRKISEDSFSQVVFFSRRKRGNQVRTIEILKNGSYEDTHLLEFRNFFVREQLDLIKI
jgi:predicted ATPase